MGVADHGGWAILVTASREGELLDRRRVVLVDEDLPPMPHHVEGQQLPVAEAVALVERVRASAERRAVAALDEVALAVAGRIGGVALRRCPELPATVAERLRDYRARNTADWVMYREAIAGAAAARGWRVYWYEARAVVAEAEGALGVEMGELRKVWGAPWSRDYQVAMAAAVVAGR